MLPMLVLLPRLQTLGKHIESMSRNAMSDQKHAWAATRGRRARMWPTVPWKEAALDANLASVSEKGAYPVL